jgi:hypothetical protein
MRKIFVMAVFACFAAMNVNAQTAETESKNEKMLRLTKAADENPADWKAQWEAGRFLLGKEKKNNLSQAEKYYERLFPLATAFKKEIPDSVIREAGLMLVAAAGDKKDFDKALFYVDEMLRAPKVGVEIGDGCLNVMDFWGIVYSMIKEDMVRSLAYMMDFRERLAKGNNPGIENTDMTTILLFEKLIEKYNDMFGDKLVEMTFDNKKYIVISKDDWNIEKPLMGWMKETEGDQESLYYCCDDGTVTDDLHGEWNFSFNYDKDGFKQEDATNTRLITVTPERRQQLVDAYRKYMKKSKKNK